MTSQAPKAIGNRRLFAARPQQTLQGKCSVQGFGFWSGLDVTVEFRPAPPDHGVVFVRRDLPGLPRVAARIANRTDGPRRTTLSVDGTAVDMVEHVLAALAGLRVDNCLVYVDRAEMPGLDGSSRPFVEAILRAGLVRQAAFQPAIVIEKTIRVGDDKAWLLAEPAAGGCQLTYELHYPDDPAIGEQACSARLEPAVFEHEIAAARTFVTQDEAELLRQQGLGRRVSFRDLLVFDSRGPVDNRLRYPNECARHKLLDMIGDFALAGCDLVGRITAHRSGHRLNAELVRTLLAHANPVAQIPSRKSA